MDLIQAIFGTQEFTDFVLKTVLAVAGIFTSVVIFQLNKLVLSKLSTTDLTALNSIAAIAVTFVEQKFIDLDGPAKYAAAEKTVDSFLADNGLKFTAEQIRAAIESAVFTEIDNAPATDPVEPTGEVS